ncbi:heme A synthase [Actinosynnema pretiosum subsp. pretiosum]|uniref:Cytochrome oxidase assembly n=2 Tax=Actinosynnema TaxID=40566 RepID=C6W8E2_ACTMD|nr:COX15/CtaA family protein [Actinosynnema mirum]ACU38989.1 cytochrome oxidase assembly [Actinosynnema mirum DSM 43827]AXX32582.1 cytochrome oxidase assembly [Actinosynnema pretiosum subsp. pretiosum]QUF03519.1 heme A synthase [Actinosynnema pretiosum subsp. pretiosum]
MSAPSWFTSFLRSGQRSFAIAAVLAQAGITVTGSIVRVTGSGLGCPTWPQCFEGSFTPVEHPEVAALHQWVEFGNRTLTGVITIITALTVLAAWFDRPRRPRVLKLALVQFGGVVVQAVVGGITVLAGLAWWTVSVHFLISMVLVWYAVFLVGALREGDAPPRALLPRPLMALQSVQVGVLGLLLVAGTFTTAAGPHAGDADTPRLQVDIETVAQLHADLLFLFLGMLIALGFALHFHLRAARKRYWLLVAAVLAQGTSGMVQYFLGIPEALVSLHVLGSAVVVVATAGLWLVTRVRDVEGAGDQREGLRSQSEGSSVASHA